MCFRCLDLSGASTEEIMGMVAMIDAAYGAPPLTRRDVIWGVLLNCVVLAGCWWLLCL